MHTSKEKKEDNVVILDEDGESEVVVENGASVNIGEESSMLDQKTKLANNVENRKNVRKDSKEEKIFVLEENDNELEVSLGNEDNVNIGAELPILDQKAKLASNVENENIEGDLNGTVNDEGDGNKKIEEEASLSNSYDLGNSEELAPKTALLSNYSKEDCSNQGKTIKEEIDQATDNLQILYKKEDDNCNNNCDNQVKEEEEFLLPQGKKGAWECKQTCFYISCIPVIILLSVIVGVAVGSLEKKGLMPEIFYDIGRFSNPYVLGATFAAATFLVLFVATVIAACCCFKSKGAQQNAASDENSIDASNNIIDKIYEASSIGELKVEL